MEETAGLPVTVGVRLSARHAAQLRELAASDERTPTFVARKFIVRALEEVKQDTAGAVQ
jgi:hypothetical protein